MERDGTFWMHNSLELQSLGILSAVYGVYLFYFVKEKVHFSLTERVRAPSPTHNLSPHVRDS